MAAPLSAVELIKQYQKQSTEDDYTTGMKHEDTDGSFLQSKQLQFLQGQFAERLCGEKVNKQGSLCIGDYDMKRRIVSVRKVKGKIWSHFGYTVDGEMLLFPEEAYFLMDVSVLRVYLQGVPMSMQEAFHYFFKDDDLSLNHYLVYAHLCRLGYIVRRMLKANCEEGHQAVHRSKRKQELVCDDLKSKSLKHDCKPEACFKTIESKSEDATLGDGNFVTLVTQPECPTSRLTNFDYTNIEFPVSGGMRVRGADITYDDESDVRDVPTIHALTQHFDYFSIMDYRGTKSVTKAASWPKFKAAHKERLHTLPLSSSNDSPLVCTSNLVVRDLSEILDSLQLSSVSTLDSLSQSKTHGTMDSNSVIFDVYQPNPNFRKSNPGTPHHRVTVVGSQEAVPDLASIAKLMSVGDGVPVYYAICDSGDISFYCYTPECIKPEIYDDKKAGNSRRRKSHKTSQINKSETVDTSIS